MDVTRKMWDEVARGLSGEIPYKQGIENASNIFEAEIERKCYECFECLQSGTHRCDECIFDDG